MVYEQRISPGFCQNVAPSFCKKVQIFNFSNVLGFFFAGADTEDVSLVYQMMKMHFT
jgi:hypothetical protein